MDALCASAGVCSLSLPFRRRWCCPLPASPRRRLLLHSPPFSGPPAGPSLPPSPPGLDALRFRGLPGFSPESSDFEDSGSDPEEGDGRGGAAWAFDYGEEGGERGGGEEDGTGLGPSSSFGGQYGDGGNLNPSSSFGGPSGEEESARAGGRASVMALLERQLAGGRRGEGGRGARGGVEGGPVTGSSGARDETRAREARRRALKERYALLFAPSAVADARRRPLPSLPAALPTSVDLASALAPPPDPSATPVVLSRAACAAAGVEWCGDTTGEPSAPAAGAHPTPGSGAPALPSSRLPPRAALLRLLRTARAVADGGRGFESLVRVRMAGRAGFGFLQPNHADHALFRHAVERCGEDAGRAARGGGAEQRGDDWEGPEGRGGESRAKDGGGEGVFDGPRPQTAPPLPSLPPDSPPLAPLPSSPPDSPPLAAPPSSSPGFPPSPPPSSSPGSPPLAPPPPPNPFPPGSFPFRLLAAADASARLEAARSWRQAVDEARAVEGALLRALALRAGALEGSARRTAERRDGDGEGKKRKRRRGGADVGGWAPGSSPSETLARQRLLARVALAARAVAFWSDRKRAREAQGEPGVSSPARRSSPAPAPGSEGPAARPDSPHLGLAAPPPSPPPPPASPRPSAVPAFLEALRARLAKAPEETQRAFAFLRAADPWHPAFRRALEAGPLGGGRGEEDADVGDGEGTEDRERTAHRALSPTPSTDSLDELEAICGA